MRFGALLSVPESFHRLYKLLLNNYLEIIGAVKITVKHFSSNRRATKTASGTSRAEKEARTGIPKSERYFSIYMYVLYIFFRK